MGDRYTMASRIHTETMRFWWGIAESPQIGQFVAELPQ